MSINFSPFEIGRRALAFNQRGINVTGQNIANVNTPGYTRRNLTSANPNAAFNRQLIGADVSLDGVRSFRDRFVESRLNREIGAAGRFAAESNALAPVEIVLQGTENSGISRAMTQFFGAFRDLEANPNSQPLRSIAARNGVNLANAFNTTNNQLGEIRRTTDAQINASVGELNRVAAQIADLNQKIQHADATGANAFELRDQRGELVRQAAEIGGAHATENADGTVTLTIGEGRAIVAGDKHFELEAESQPPHGLTQITLDGQPAVFDDGKIRGLQNAVDAIGKQIANLDNLAAAVASRVNALHSSGTDADGSAGTNFFRIPVGGGAITAANFAVNPAITANPRLIVASPLQQPGASGTVAGQIANLLTDNDSIVNGKTGSFAQIFGSFVSDAGEQVKTAANNLETQVAVIAQTTAQREAVSGVSLDEEAINLLQYQKAYDAAAKFLKIADEMTQTILSLAQ